MGRVSVRGGSAMSAPVNGIRAEEIAVGSSVYLRENGAAAEYLVVNQGVPSGSSLYDASCDGTWLMRKGIYNYATEWYSTNNNRYAKSKIHTYLNETFLAIFDASTQEAIRTVKIPYGYGGSSTGVYHGENGLSARIFELSGYELGLTYDQFAEEDYLVTDGACLSFFDGMTLTDSRRIAYLSGKAVSWWTRSPCGRSSNHSWAVNNSGGVTLTTASGTTCYIRPALIVPKTALFDTQTLELKGAA